MMGTVRTAIISHTMETRAAVLILDVGKMKMRSSWLARKFGCYFRSRTVSTEQKLPDNLAPEKGACTLKTWLRTNTPVRTIDRNGIASPLLELPCWLFPRPKGPRGRTDHLLSLGTLSLLVRESRCLAPNFGDF